MPDDIYLACVILEKQNISAALLNYVYGNAYTISVQFFAFGGPENKNLDIDGSKASRKCL